MSILPAPVTMSQSKPRVNIGRKLPTSSGEHQDSESQEFGWFSSTRPVVPSSRELLTPIIVITEDTSSTTFDRVDCTLPVPAVAHLNDTKLPSPSDASVVGLAQKVGQLVSLVVNMEHDRGSRGNCEDVLRREIRTLHDQKDSLHLQVASLRKILRTSSRRLNDCVDASTVAMDMERGLRQEVEAKARRSEAQVKSLLDENAHLTRAKAAVERELVLAVADSKAWQNKVRAAQDMQEMAMTTYHRCEALEKENAELRQAMHVFAQGSTTVIVQQLQVMIERLSDDLAQQKKLNAATLSKDKKNYRDENTNMLGEMRKKTTVLQRRSRQLSEYNGDTTLAAVNTNCHLHT